MTIIAGAISRDGHPLPGWLRDALIRNLSRHAGDIPETLAGDAWLLAKVDVGAFGCKGTFTHEDGSALMIAGEPLLSGAEYEACRNRQDEGRMLAGDLAVAGVTSLQAATGAFCGAYYSAPDHRLTLMADKLGLRPIYYLVTPQFAAFASALRILEVAGLASGELDLRGTYQTCSFGFPLGTRTCYAGIRTIGAGELVHVTRESEDHFDYFRWDRLDRTDGKEDRLIAALTRSFDRAVARRLRDDRSALAFLSGGLDSRTIVATLRSRGTTVFTVNFAPPGTQDRVFGTLVATALGTRHHQLDAPQSSAKDVYRQEFLEQWVTSLESSGSSPERPRCIWSGDGGSVALGHVYLDDAAVGQFEHANVEEGIRAFARYNRIDGVATTAMAAGFREQSRNWHIEGIRDEIAHLEGRPDGRMLHLFLMLNDQRRHMAAHYENIDRFRFEFLMPFFDSEFLEVILRAPSGPFLRHALYHKWLMAAHPAATAVPWQTYPNHEPCPVPSPEQLRYQFADYYDRAEVRRIARKRGWSALPDLWSGTFPRHLVDRRAYASAIATCLLGWNSYAHIVRVGHTFTSHWQRARSAAPPGFIASPSTRGA